MKTHNISIRFLLLMSFLMVFSASRAQESKTLNAAFTYFFSWTSTYEIIMYNYSSGAYDQIEWDMGDGTIYNFDQSQHTYAEGYYEITLTISDSQSGASSSYSLDVSIPSTGCNNTFAYEATGDPNEISFTGIFTYTPYPSGLTFEWDFGDGTTATGSAPVHTFPESGVDYEVSLTTTVPSTSCSFTSTQIVNSGFISDCFADFEYEIVSQDGMTLQFNNTSFTIGGGEPTSVTWDFGDYNTSNELNPSHTYYDNGTYNVIFTIYDSITNCSDVTGMEVVVDGNPPLRANFYYYFTSYYDILLIENTTGNISEYEWNMGDGTIINGPLSQYQYSEDGTFDITLLVTDGATDQQISYTLPITLPNSLCNAYFFYESSGEPGEFNFTGLTPYYAIPYYEGFEWDFGDGTTSSGRNVTHTFDTLQSNSFVVTLTHWSTDYFAQDTCFFSIVDTVYVALQANVAMEPDPADPLSIHFSDISEGEPQSWFWEFGDGNTSMMKNPAHTYAETGTYEVCLTVYRDNMPPDVICMEIELATVGLDETNLTELNSVLSPNPNNGTFSIALDSKKSDPVDILIYNSMGALVYKNSFSGGTSQISVDLGSAPAGVYQVVSSQGQNRLVNKMFVN